MRLDKFLAHTGFGSRKEVKALVRQKRVARQSGETFASGQEQIDPDRDIILVDGETVEYVKYVYVMLNKPEGVISAVTDPYGADTTASDLVAEATGISGLFPVGRLDKDATGLLILTNDGIFTHRATSPKKNVEKVYVAEVSGLLTSADIDAFTKGISLDDGYRCRSAKLDILEAGDSSVAKVTVTEGKYHQVKRMFQALGKHVDTLRRVAFAGIELPDDLPPGGVRPLSPEELAIIEPYLAED